MKGGRQAGREVANKTVYVIIQIGEFKVEVG